MLWYTTGMAFLRVHLARIAFIVFALVFMNWAQFLLTTIFLEYGGSWMAFLAQGVDGRFATAQLLNLLFGMLFGSLFAFFVVRGERSGSFPLVPKALQGKNTDPLQIQKQANDAKCNTIHVIADQLQNGHSVLLNNLALLRDKEMGKLSATQERILHATERATRRMEQQLQSLQLTLQLDNNTFVLQLAPVQPAKLLRQIVAAFQPAAKLAGVKLTVSTRQPNLVMDLDTEKIAYALRSLLDNALQYTPEHGTVQASFEVGEGRALFLVKDSGIGVPTQEQKYLFGKYYRGTQADEYTPEGAGLGLYLTKMIARAHGGDVELVSRPGVGTEVLISLPFSRSSSLHLTDT